uniref:Protein Wnt n=1 Tax=Panagrellus redivivus TaxID=6233 RepID=A0A7E4ZVT8_PANRE
MSRVGLLIFYGVLSAAFAYYEYPYNWLSIALSGATKFENTPDQVAKDNYRSICKRFSGLNPRQVDMCEKYPLLIPAVARSAREAIYECQRQFKFERWNCSERFDVYPNTSVDGLMFQDFMGKTLRGGNRETAYLTALTSAGIVHAVTRLCSSGNISECTCHNRPASLHFVDTSTVNEVRHQVIQKVSPKSRFVWGGCSDDATFATHFSKQFLDLYDQEVFQKSGEAKYLTNVHNNFVGREAINQNMRRHCRCHGVSGSCELQTCWLQMPKYKEVSEMLKQRYNHFAVQVSKKAKRRLRRKDKAERMTPLRGNEMAYVYRSPDYCNRNDALGIIGTSGRECSITSYGPESCDLLCCGRGYNTRDEIRTIRCHCKFVWCCQVKCKECKEHVQIHTCK